MQQLGKFIAIEGLEGAGKSSAIAHIVRVIAATGKPVTTVREPGGTPFAEALRSLIKQNWQEPISATSELLLMYASRVQLVEQVIKPALAVGTWVVGDRHDLSSRAYQGGGRQLGDKTLTSLRDLVMPGFHPDLTIILDVEPSRGLERARQRGELDRIEREDLAFFERTRATYLQIAATEPNMVVIDANQPLDEVSAALTKALQQVLSR